MAHTVKIDVPSHQLAHANVEFLIKKDGQAFGKLLISKGAIVWRPSPKSKRSRKLSWARFDSLMQEMGRNVRGG